MKLTACLAALRARPDLFDDLSDAEALVLATIEDFWIREEQQIPTHHWRTCGAGAARGFGKSWIIAREINRRVMAGEESHILLMAPTDDRVLKAQIEPLIETADPWARPVWTASDSTLTWPNGVKAYAFTSQEPERPRGENASLAWCTELLDWKESTAVSAFNNISTATRRGRAQIFWDSTSKGVCEVIEQRYLEHDADPVANPIILGTTFQNPLFSPQYLRSERGKYSGVRLDEEMYGKRVGRAAGALWKPDWIKRTRVELAPPLEMYMVGVDPANSVTDTSDLTGLSFGGRARDGHVYLLEDGSDKLPAEGWGDKALGWIPDGGFLTIERNNLGDAAVAVIRSRADKRGLRVQTLGREEPWPPFRHGWVYVREQWSRDSKGTRAEGPATETEQGRVHLVGEHPDLEKEMVTYVPGQRRSPNRLDAAVFVVTELRGLTREVKGDAAGDMAAAALLNSQLRGSTSAGAGRAQRLGL